MSPLLASLARPLKSEAFMGLQDFPSSHWTWGSSVSSPWPFPASAVCSTQPAMTQLSWLSTTSFTMLPHGYPHGECHFLYQAFHAVSSHAQLAILLSDLLSLWRQTASKRGRCQKTLMNPALRHLIADYFKSQATINSHERNAIFCPRDSPLLVCKRGLLKKGRAVTAWIQTRVSSAHWLPSVPPPAKFLTQRSSCPRLRVLQMLI